MGRSRKQLHGSRSSISLASTIDAFKEVSRRKELDGTFSSSAMAETGELQRDATVVISSGKLIKTPKVRSDSQPLSERRRGDREAIVKLQDKISLTTKHTYLHKVLKAYDPDNKGALTPDALHSALTRLNLGLSPEEISRAVSRLRAPESDLIPYQSLFSWAHSISPLGARQMDDGYPASASEAANPGTTTYRLPRQLPTAGTDQGNPNLAQAEGSTMRAMTAPASTVDLSGFDGDTLVSQSNNSRTKAPWESLQGHLHAWNWELKPQGLAGVTGPAEDGSYEQKKQDSLLISLLSERLTQSVDKLRRTFRKWDTSRNGQLSKPEFISALEAMHLNVPKPQLERLFDIADVNGSGEVDYVEFVKAFDAGINGTSRKVNPDEAKSRTQPLGATLSPPMSVDEVDVVVRSQLTAELAKKLVAKASAAHAVFGAYDTNGDGYLSLQELTTCCQALVPGISHRHVACLLTVCDPSGDGYLNYREFIDRLVDNAPAHHKMMNIHLAGPEASRLATRSLWGQSPLFAGGLKPSSLRQSHEFIPGDSFTASRQLTKSLSDEGKAPNTVWTKEDMPTPGYTGVIQPHLREPSLFRMSSEERRLLMHKAGVEPMITSLTSHPLATANAGTAGAGALSGTLPASAFIADTNHTIPNRSTTPPAQPSSSPIHSPKAVASRSNGITHTSVDDSSLLPWDVAGAPPLPPEKRTRATVPGARHHQLAESQPLPPAGTPGSERRHKREIRDTSALRNMIPHRWGPAGDAELSTSLPIMRLGGTEMTGSFDRKEKRLAATSYAHDAPKALKGKARFTWLSNADTTHVTSVMPTSSQWCDPCDTWVRKSGSDFMSYQQQDRLRKAIKMEACGLRDSQRAAEIGAREAARAEREEANKSALIQAKGMVKARYVERCIMYDDARAAHVPHSSAILSRSHFFSDHVILDPTLARS